MADHVLKFPQEAAPSRPSTKSRRRLIGAMRRYRRTLLLVVLPFAALVGGVTPIIPITRIGIVVPTLSYAFALKREVSTKSISPATLIATP